MKIAIVEDEPKLARIIEGYLQKEGYRTQHFTDGKVALEQLLQTPADLVLLDLMLPGMDGMSVCKALRQEQDTAIIMITARVEEVDRLLGLEVGADDYICKPFSPREVVARVKAVLRRCQPDEQQSEEDSTLQIDEDRAIVTLANQNSCTLTLVELRLLKTLSSRPGQIFSRDQLMQRIYPDNRIVSDRTIDSHIKKLRQKLHAISPDTEFLHSVYGIGYKFETPLEE